MLNQLPKAGRCSQITESRMIEFHFAQNFRPLDYFAVISDCRILNGSWITRPLKYCREILNLPSQKFYKSFDSSPIYFIGKEKALSNYLEQVDNLSARDIPWKSGDIKTYQIIRKDKAVPSP